jgi:hypothetical protein
MQRLPPKTPFEFQFSNTMKNLSIPMLLTLIAAAVLGSATSVVAQTRIERFALYEASFKATGRYSNPYTDLEAMAEMKLPNGRTRTRPLFWDGGSTWKLRVSPDITGKWSYTIQSKDKGLNGKRGSFESIASNRSGSIEPMKGYPHHFQRQDGSPFLFWGDTAWGLYLDQEEENNNRENVFRYIDKRASEGVNVMHSMLLSEAGWGNQGGPPFEDITTQEINPAYWQEVDVRLRYLNDKGIVGGLALAWGNKGRQERYSWGNFPSVEARKRYARYIAARYSAFEVYFIVSGEWNGEVKNRENTTKEEVQEEFIALGNVVKNADGQGRMIGIHPMTAEGSVSQFNVADWMSFADYQQNYRDLHGRILERRSFNKPIVNSEYGYYLRDSNYDGIVDKDNSITAEDIRYATWDIIMASGYPVTGYASTYMGGFRDKGPFNPDDPRNNVWAAQYRLAQYLLSKLDWWKLEHRDGWISAAQPRTMEREVSVQMTPERTLKVLRPPATTYWLLADPGKQYVAYGRGLDGSVEIKLGSKGTFSGYYYDPETGITEELAFENVSNGVITWTPPNSGDWVLVLNKS